MVIHSWLFSLWLEARKSVLCHHHLWIDDFFRCQKTIKAITLHLMRMIVAYLFHLSIKLLWLKFLVQLVVLLLWVSSWFDWSFGVKDLFGGLLGCSIKFSVKLYLMLRHTSLLDSFIWWSLVYIILVSANLLCWCIWWTTWAICFRIGSIQVVYDWVRFKLLYLDDLLGNWNSESLYVLGPFCLHGRVGWCELRVVNITIIDYFGELNADLFYLILVHLLHVRQLSILKLPWSEWVIDRRCNLWITILLLNHAILPELATSNRLTYRSTRLLVI